MPTAAEILAMSKGAIPPPVFVLSFDSAWRRATLKRGQVYRVRSQGLGFRGWAWCPTFDGALQKATTMREMGLRVEG